MERQQSAQSALAVATDPHFLQREESAVALSIQTHRFAPAEMIRELSEYARNEGIEYRFMELPQFYADAAQIVQNALKEKFPPGGGKISILGAAEISQGPEGERKEEP